MLINWKVEATKSDKLNDICQQDKFCSSSCKKEISKKLRLFLLFPQRRIWFWKGRMDCFIVIEIHRNKFARFRGLVRMARCLGNFIDDCVGRCIAVPLDHVFTELGIPDSEDSFAILLFQAVISEGKIFTKIWNVNM